jgi:hypothetical protein
MFTYNEERIANNLFSMQVDGANGRGLNTSPYYMWSYSRFTSYGVGDTALRWVIVTRLNVDFPE